MYTRDEETTGSPPTSEARERSEESLGESGQKQISSLGKSSKVSRPDPYVTLPHYGQITAQVIFDYYFSYKNFRDEINRAASRAINAMGVSGWIPARRRGGDPERNPEYQRLRSYFSMSTNYMLLGGFSDRFKSALDARSMREALTVAAELSDPTGRALDKNLEVWIAEHATAVDQGCPSILDTLMAIYLAQTKGRNQSAYANTVLRELSGFVERVFEPHPLDVVFRRDPFAHLLDGSIRIPLMLARSKDTPNDTITLAHEVIDAEEAQKAKKGHKTSARVDRIIHGAPEMINAIIGRQVFSLADMNAIYDGVIGQLPRLVSELNSAHGEKLSKSIDDLLSAPTSEKLKGT